jgi:hypothetical protein
MDGSVISDSAAPRPIFLRPSKIHIRLQTIHLIFVYNNDVSSHWFDIYKKIIFFMFVFADSNKQDGLLVQCVQPFVVAHWTTSGHTPKEVAENGEMGNLWRG